MSSTKEKLDLTVIIITYNEEKNIKKCIDSIKGFVKDIFVLDSDSSDTTQKILIKNNIRFKSKKFFNYSNQFNTAIKLANAKTTWLMRLDADEVVEKNFFKLLKSKINKLHNNIDGVYINRRYIFFGKEIKNGGVFPHKTLRIWRNGKGKCNNELMDEKIITKSNQTFMNLNIIDDNKNPFYLWKIKHIRYAKFEAMKYLNRSKVIKKNDPIIENINFRRFKIYYNIPIFLRAVLLFLYRYIFKFGFLDGLAGLRYCFWQTLWFRLLVDINIFKLKKNNKSKYRV